MTLNWCFLFIQPNLRRYWRVRENKERINIKNNTFIRDFQTIMERNSYDLYKEN